MIASLDDLKQYKLSILLYATGASGEFIAGALTKSIPKFSRYHDQWISKNRKSFGDALGKTLNGGWNNIDPSEVIQRFNFYLTQTNSGTESLHMALAHPDLASLDFMRQYLAHVPVIEITTTTYTSIKFRNHSRLKVSYEDYMIGGDNAKNPMSREKYLRWQNDSSLDAKKVDYHCDQHLQIEWQDLLITNTAKKYEEICNFLQCEGSVSEFKQDVEEYLDRNQDILDQIHC